MSSRRKVEYWIQERRWKEWLDTPNCLTSPECLASELCVMKNRQISVCEIETCSGDTACERIQSGPNRANAASMMTSLMGDQAIVRLNGDSTAASWSLLK